MNINIGSSALFVLLAPWGVADSKDRRGDEMFVEEPDLAMKIWIHYNQKLLGFCDKFPNRCFVAGVYNVSLQPSALIHALNNKFNSRLERPAADLSEQSLLHTQASELHHPGLVNAYFPEAIKFYQKLNARERQCGLPLIRTGIKKL